MPLTNATRVVQTILRLELVSDGSLCSTSEFSRMDSRWNVYKIKLTLQSKNKNSLTSKRSLSLVEFVQGITEIYNNDKYMY